MDKKQTVYKAWLLRVWQARNAGRMEWRASLEDPHTKQRIGFATLERLYAFLLDARLGDAVDETAPRTEDATTRPNEPD